MNFGPQFFWSSTFLSPAMKFFFRLSRVFDCRLEDSYRAWVVNGEVERVLWNHFSPFSFLVSIQLISHFLIYTFNKKKNLFTSKLDLNLRKKLVCSEHGSVWC